MATKAELEAEVKVLRARVAALEPDGAAAAHIARLEELAELVKRDEELDARGFAVLNQIYRQMGEVLGVLRARRAGTGGAAKAGAAVREVPADAPLDKVANMVRFKREQGQG